MKQQTKCIMHACTLMIVLLVVATGTAADASAQESGTSPTGSVLNGFATSLSLGSPSYNVGQPVVVRVEYRNMTERILHGSLVLHADYGFTLTNVGTDKVVEPLAEPVFEAQTFSLRSGGLSIDPGHSLYDSIKLNNYYALTTPGTYRLQLTKPPILNPGTLSPAFLLPSNTVTFTLTAQ